MHSPAGEQWSPHSVTLRLARRPVWLAILWTVALAMIGYALFFQAFALLVLLDSEWVLAGAMFSLPSLVAAGLAVAAVVGSYWHLRVQALTVSIGRDQLDLGGRVFDLAAIADCRWQLGWFVVKLHDGSVYRSPELEPEDPERLVALIRQAIPESAALDAAEPDPASVGKLASLLQRAPEGG